MTPRCACGGPLYPCDLLSGLTTCVECARRFLRTSRQGTHANVTAAIAARDAAQVTRPLGKITPEEWATFTAALSAAARGSEVHQRDMRPLIRGRIQPKHIPSCYSRAIALGLIREVRRERSNDVIGRNTNKDEPVYALDLNALEVAA